MKPILIFVIMLFCTGFAYAGDADCNKKKIEKRVDCNKVAPKLIFKGTKKLEKPIRVVVCHPYWFKLNEGELPDGRKTRWWGPTISHGKWSANLPAAAEECKVFWVKPGSRISTKASCVNRVITTKPMLTPGKYTME